MQWLPGIPVRDRRLFLPISDADSTRLLRALSELDTNLRRGHWVRFLARSPTGFVWGLSRAPEASNATELLDALTDDAFTAGDFTVASSPPAEFHFPSHWRSTIGGCLNAMREAFAARGMLQPHIGGAVRPMVPERMGAISVGIQRGATASATVGIPRDAWLESFESLVRVFWPEGGGDPRSWLETMFAPFHFALGPRDRALVDAEFGQVDIESDTESWQPSETIGVNEMFGSLVERLLRANRLEADFANEKLSAMKQLAYGASHEINNPLANIATRAQLLLASEKDESRRKHLVTIFQQAMRAHEMISDMMLFAHPPAPRLARVDLTELVPRAVDEFRPFVEQARWTIDAAVQADSLVVSADSNQIIAMLQAIVLNAVESRPAGKISLACLPPIDGRAVVEIRDNGPGVSTEAKNHMFDPFFSGREAGRGLGFGLSKAWTIARLHGGNIRVQSTGPTGTTMAIELPLTPG